MPRQVEQAEIVGVTTYNNMLALDGSKKLFCPGCGGPRDVKYAETVPCSCCGALGTQKVQPLFDEHGEPLSADDVAKLRAAQAQERAARKPASAEAAPVAPVAKPKAAAPKPVAQKAQPKPAAKSVKQTTARERKQTVTSTLASMF